MIPKRVGIASRSQYVGLHELTNVAAALNLQVQRDLYPIWNISATVSALPDPESIEPGVWPIFIVDDTGFDGALGLHLTEHKQPYALVQSGRTWSLTASHELLEMIVDPSGNWLIPSTGIGVDHGGVKDLPGAKFEYLVEIADPSEAPGNAYMIDDILVSDFYTPHFFDHAASPGVRYSFSGKIKRPREVLPGGYISWMNPKLGKMQQLKWLDSSPAVVDLPGHPAASGRQTLRGFVDSQTQLPERLSQLGANSVAVKKQQERVQYLETASTLRSAAYALARRPTGAVVLPGPEEAQRVLDKNKSKVQVKGATKAYVGWHFENGWITRERAIVVLARRADVDSVRNRVPDKVGDFVVDVRVDPRPPRGGEALGMLLAAESGTTREELAVPQFPGEISFEDPVTSALAAAKAHKPQITYEPADVALAAVTADMTLLLHVSPEQGWAQLKPFLQNVERELVVGIYEFTAPHIEKSLLDGLDSPDKLTLTLDSPPAKGTREQTVEQTHDHLSSKLKRRLSFAWALSGLGHDAPAMAFPTAYHIKVAVKDAKSFWLSSGNWNSSNQPDVDLSDEAALKSAARNNDRDWHVICDCPQLAKVYKAYLLKDYETANDAAAAPGRAAAVALGAAAGPPQIEQPDILPVAARAPRNFFEPHKLQAKIKVKPLLTPDDYRKPILELITGAKRRLFMQTQYIHPVNADDDDEAPFGGPKHMELIAALAKLITDGVDVRLITSEYQDHSWIERLQDAGVDAVEHLRIQPHVHNKGIVVDSEIVVVSSQNWSSQGTGANRDAGMIIYNAEAAQYFEEIFLHDWVNMAAAKVLR
jgi:phospholipase D-like protein